MQLDENSSEPLYKQLENILKQKIDNDVWHKGSKIPTELELSKLYDVSRITVRKALDGLSKQNLIIKHSGKGTFVNNDKIQRLISGVTSFTSLCEAQNLSPGAKTIKSVIEVPDASDQKVLSLTDADRIISIERIRYADNVPVSVEVCHFTERFSFLLDENLTDISMYKLIQEKHHITFECSQKIVEIVFATYELAKYLNVSSGYPLLLISSELVLPDGEKICFNRQYILGDRFQLVI